MPLSKLTFRPGIVREGTQYDNEGGWFDCNLIRFRQGRPEKFAGWEEITSSTYLGTSRALHNWIALDGTKYLGNGTHLKYYIKEGNNFNDVTPIRLTTSAGDVTFSASNGDATITVTDTAHGAVQNDFVTFSGASSLGGNITAAVLNQEYQVATVVNANSYTIEAKDTSDSTVTANSSDTGNGGSSVVGAYQVNTGLDNFVASTGWGVNPWGDGTWGSSTSLSSVNQLRIWTHDNFGENLIINPRGAGIFEWIESNGVTTRAVNLSTRTGANLVPTVGLQVITSEIDRHLIVLGADPINDAGTARTGTIDPMLIAFSDQENELEFEPKITNTAGSLRLSSGSQIIGAVKSRQEIVIFTDTAVYSMQFVGPPFTFRVNLINESSGLIGPKASVTAPQGIYFMSYDNFYIYNGSVQKLPCNVLNYVFSDINQSQAFKINAFTNTKENEVGWFYPSSTSNEVDRYVIYNFQDKVWYYGQLSRTAWLDSGVESFPQATSTSKLFQHEIGFNDDGSPMTGVFIESSDFDLGDGDSFQFIRRILPDVRFIEDPNNGSVNLVVKTRNGNGATLSTKSTSEVKSDTDQLHIRARARQAVLRLESNDDAVNDGNLSVGWRLGATRMDIKQDGRK
tara:strand:+ start:1988 stop:3862 length:1875 start_codon:yes stop_codon:yes gene_type:complete